MTTPTWEAVWPATWWDAPARYAATVLVDGADVAAVPGSLRWDDSIGERSICEFASRADVQVLEGHQVHVVDGDRNVLWGGLVAPVDESSLDGTNRGRLHRSVTCVDWHALVDRDVVARGWEDTTTGQIVRDIVADHLAAQGIHGHPWPGALHTIAGPHLAGWWRLADGTADESWQATAATEVGGPTYSGAGTDSPVGDDHLGGHMAGPAGAGVTIPAATAPTGASPRTVAMWVRGGAADEAFLTHGQDTAGRLWRQLADPATGANRIEWNGGALVDTTSGVDLTDGEWHWVAATHDDGLLTLFTDGAAVGQAAVDLDTADTLLHVRTDPQGSHWTGDVAEVTVIARDATPSELEVLHGRVGLPSRIAEGPTIARAVVSYQPSDIVLDAVAELAAHEWRVDAYRTLHMHPRGATCCDPPATFATTPVLAGSVSAGRDSPSYRSRQIIRGGRDRTTTQIETWVADGEATTVPVGFPIAEQPTVELEDGVGAGTYTAQTVGIAGVQDGTDWTWSKGEAHVTAAAAPADGLRVRVSYVGEFALVLISSDRDAITDTVATEKTGTGVITAVDDDSSIEDRLQGFEVAGAKLARHAIRARQLTFTTRAVSGFAAGQLLEVADDHHDLDGSMLIDRVDVTEAPDSAELRWTVHATSGPALKSWVQLITAAERRVRTAIDLLTVGQDETVIILADPINETTVVDETVDVVALACAPMGSDLGFDLC